MERAEWCTPTANHHPLQTSGTHQKGRGQRFLDKLCLPHSLALGAVWGHVRPFVVPLGRGRSRLPFPGSRVGSCPDTAVTCSSVTLVCVMSHSCWSTRGLVHRIWGSRGAQSAAFPYCHVRFMALLSPGPVPRRGSSSTVIRGQAQPLAAGRTRSDGSGNNRIESDSDFGQGME